MRWRGSRSTTFKALRSSRMHTMNYLILQSVVPVSDVVQPVPFLGSNYRFFNDSRSSDTSYVQILFHRSHTNLQAMDNSSLNPTIVLDLDSCRSCADYRLYSALLARRLFLLLIWGGGNLSDRLFVYLPTCNLFQLLWT